MKKQSFLLISITFVSFAQVSASEETQYLQCSYTNDSLEKNFYWSIAPEDNIQKWGLVPQVRAVSSVAPAGGRE